MPILNFKEIPEAHIATGMQDTFELFARDFLSFMGYKIVTDPDRGQIVRETGHEDLATPRLPQGDKAVFVTVDSVGQRLAKCRQLKGMNVHIKVERRAGEEGGADDADVVVDELALDLRRENVGRIVNLLLQNEWGHFRGFTVEVDNAVELNPISHERGLNFV